ncbi:MAG: CHAD domain-containing protein [Pseudomonadota bacterium]
MPSQRKQAVAVKSLKVKLRRNMKLEQAAHEILANCLEQIQGNQSAIKTGADPDCVRQMHIGLRRLRSALKLFNNSFLLPVKLQAELDYVSEKLGAARDWQVFSGSTLVVIEAIAPEEVKLPSLQQAAMIIASKKQKEIYTSMKSRRSARLMSALSAWLKKPQIPETDESFKHKKSTTKLPLFAKKILSHQQKNLIKRGKELFKTKADTNPQANHKFRIAIKKVRYSCEFFENFFRKKGMHAYISSLSALQDILGNINDGAVAVRLLGEIAQQQDNHISDCSFALGYLLSQSQLNQQELRSLWKQFKDIHLPNLK